MDVRLTSEQRQLRDAAAKLADDLGPGSVQDLDDDSRVARLEKAVDTTGWRALRSDGASGVEVAIVAELRSEAFGLQQRCPTFTQRKLVPAVIKRQNLAVAPKRSNAPGERLARKRSCGPFKIVRDHQRLAAVAKVVQLTRFVLLSAR